VRTIDLDSVLRLHERILHETGGASGVRDLGTLTAAIERPASGFGNTELFRTVFLKAAALAHGIATSHPFVDGNKRTALAAAATALHINGYVLRAPPAEQERIMVSLALKETSLEQFAEWLEEHAEPL
jgi:death-on-curing protein